MNDMHLVDDLSVYTFQTSQKKQIWLSCILFYNLSEVIIQITSKGLKWISKFDGTCEGNSLLIREPWFWNGAEQSLAISDCRASIDHPERFLLEPLMVKYFMWVLSLLTLAWCCNRAVSFPFFFFLSLLLFLFLKDEVGQFWRGAKRLCMNICFSILPPLKNCKELQWSWVSDVDVNQPIRSYQPRHSLTLYYQR